jgi:thiol-disulfide isomerase/thioredoxin
MKISVPNSLASALGVWFVCLMPSVARAQLGAIEVGAPAPELTLHTVLGAPDGTKGTWQELKGKAVVIEFWATWCGGCVESIPHMNELAERLKSRPVQFISITDETDIELVKRFLMQHPISGWVAFDDNETTFHRFNIERRPETILVDANGILRGEIEPGRVTMENLEDVLAGKSLHFASPPPPPVLGR